MGKPNETPEQQSDMREWWENYLREKAAEKEQINRDSVAKLLALRARGVASIVAEYDGYGDSGTVENPTAYGDDGGEVTLTPEEMANIVLIVENNIAGDWINNEGGFGVAKFDLRKLSLLIDESYRVTEINREETRVEFGKPTASEKPAAAT